MTKPFKMLSARAHLMMRVACDPELSDVPPAGYPYSSSPATYRMLARLGYLAVGASGLVRATEAGRAYRAWSLQQPGA